MGEQRRSRDQSCHIHHTRLIILCLKNKQIQLTGTGGIELLVLVESPMPEPKSGEVRIKISAAGISLAEVLMRTGHSAILPRLPFVPGYDVVGTVDKVGSGVPKDWIGKRVAALIRIGGYAQYVNVRTDLLVPVPAKVKDAEAVALVLNYLTAYEMLFRYAQIKKRDRILVHGAGGGVGTALLDLAKLFDLRVYAVASSSKHKNLRGENVFPVDPKKHNLADKIAERDPKGVDAFFDFQGGENFKNSLRLLKKGGTAVQYDMTDEKGNLVLAYLKTIARFALINILKGRKAVFFAMNAFVKSKRSWYREDLAYLLELLETKKIRPLIGKKVPLDKVPKAHALLEKRKVLGKIVIVP